MTINISRFVRITSGVGGASAVPTRELIGRLFTTNVRVPVGEVLEFSDAPAVLDFFGPGEEYNRAAFYFGFVSKSLGSPRALSFARIALTAEPPRIFGGPASTLAALKTITEGGLVVISGVDTADVTDLDFSAAATYSDVATAIQVALRATAGPAFATATVTYDAVSGGFNLQTSTPGAGDISASGTSADAIGWGATAIYAPGAAAQTIASALTAAADVSSNFGSFAFIPALTDAQAIEAANWNGSLNVEYLACLRVTDASLVTIPPALENTGGTALTYAPDVNQYDEMLPMAVLAATNYERAGSAQNYMFQQAALEAKVSSDAMANELDAARVNYYGRTQTAGQRLAFYMRGVLCGTITDPLDMNTYANEIWLKDACRSALLSLLLSAPRVPATVEGRAQVLGVLQGPINRALTNGTISPGKELTPAQQAHITTITNDPDAWRQVQTGGYWVDAVVVLVPGTPPEYRIDYVLVYSKDDAIRQIVGTHDLV